MASLLATIHEGKVCFTASAPNDAKTAPVRSIMVFDVSGSMSEAANQNTERSVTKLKIAQIAGENTVANMDEDATLMIIAFSDSAEIKLHHTKMNAAGKKAAQKIINSLRAGGCTALWDALSLALLSVAFPGTTITLLTDGAPSTSPPEGEVKAMAKLRQVLQFKDTRVVALGFGEQSNSELLHPLADDYGYIADGTTVIPTMGCLLANLTTTVGQATVIMNGRPVILGRLCAGQTLTHVCALEGSETAAFKLALDGEVVAEATAKTDDAAFFSEVARVKAIEAIRNALDTGRMDLVEAKAIINAAYKDTKATLAPEIQQDLSGQVSLALDPRYWGTWGQHSLRALLSAHSNQSYINTKDPGPLSRQGAPAKAFLETFFKACEVAAKEAATVAASAAANARTSYGYGASAAPVMSAEAFTSLFINAEGGCIDPGAPVLLEGGATKPIRELCKGDRLSTGGTVQLVVVYEGATTVLTLRGIGITKHHPVRLALQWEHPAQLAQATDPRTVNTVYNVITSGGDGTLWLAAPGQDPLQACCLAHNIRAETDADDKVITHRYLGTDKCKDDLLAFPGAELGTVTLTARNVQRDSEGHISRYII